MRLFFTSDFHFGHKKILTPEFDGRPFETIEAHDQAIIDNINNVCSKHDQLYILGDVCHRSERKPIEYLNQLKPWIHLVWGNHDDKFRKEFNRGDFSAKRVLSAGDAAYIRFNNQKIYMHHYGCRVWRACHRGSWHLYGHSHGRLPMQGKSMDVCIANNAYNPFSFEEIKVIMDKQNAVSFDRPVITTPKEA